MNDNKNMKELVKKYHEGRLEEYELKELERMIEEGLIPLDVLDPIRQLGKQLDAIEIPPPSQRLDSQFYAMLENEKQKQQPAGKEIKMLVWGYAWPRLAAAAVLLVGGFYIGRVTQPHQQNEQGVATLTQEVSELKEMVMFSLLEKDAAAERIKAVNLTKEMDDASTKVTDALIRTLNNDENVNVRLAALEALKPFVGDSNIRMALVKSIAKQDSPLVQVSMAELMAAIQEKSSVKELQRIAHDENTPPSVREKINESINVMI